jgi:polysaccharide export outer membrane protein
MGDVVAVTVYDSPELSRSVHVGVDGTIRLPMVRQHILAAGQTPDELENNIAAALVDEHLMVGPIVSVSLVETHSRPITVIGAVRTPITFEVSGTVTLLEAIVKAGGLTENAGTEILVSHPSTDAGGSAALFTERIPLHAAMDISDPASRLKLEGGENVRVPDAGRVFVVGNVKHPGPILISDNTANSVLKAVVLSGGLDSFTSKTAYIYRVEATGASDQIPIQIKKIMTMKSPDVPLYGNDTLYIPNATGQRISVKALEITFGVGLGIAGLLIYLTQ